MSVVEKEDPALPYHAVSELYFDDEEAFAAALPPRPARPRGADVAAHAADRVRLVTLEERII